MERKKYILLALFLYVFFALSGQTRIAIYNAYINGNIVEWKKNMDSFKPDSNEQKLELINYQYGYIAFCIGQKKDNEAEKYIQKADRLIAELGKKQYRPSMCYAYKSAFVGFKIGLSPYKAPFIGPESITFAKKSVELDDADYFGYIQLGNVAFYTPSVFGGSKTEAMKHYLKALELIEKKPEALKNNWNYVNLLVTIINAYFDLKQYGLAEKYCVKTLAIEPDFDWVKNKLYPKIQKQLKNE